MLNFLFSLAVPIANLVFTPESDHLLYFRPHKNLEPQMLLGFYPKKGFEKRRNRINLFLLYRHFEILVGHNRVYVFILENELIPEHPITRFDKGIKCRGKTVNVIFYFSNFYIGVTGIERRFNVIPTDLRRADI